jgi:hypothetical protein
MGSKLVVEEDGIVFAVRDRSPISPTVISQISSQEASLRELCRAARSTH